MACDGITNVQHAIQSALLGALAPIDTKMPINGPPALDTIRLSPTTQLPNLPAWDNSSMNGVANFNLAACALANANAIYAQYAYQFRLQQLALSSCSTTSPLLMMELPPHPQQSAPKKTYKEVPIQAAEDVLADCDDMLCPRPFLSSCCVCQVQLRLQNDVQAHLLSKEHQRRVFEQEQRAVIVTGVPQEAAMAIIEVLFQGFELQPDAATFIPAMTDPASQEGLAKVLAQYRPLSEFWHVVFSSPEEAQEAAKIPDLTFGNRRLRVHLAIQPEHCITCDVTVQSAPQYEDHRRTPRHQELFRQHAARCGLSLVGLPLTVTRKELDGLLDTCEIVEGGYTIETVTKKDGTKSLTAHLVFATEADADAAHDLCKVNGPLLGENVRLLRPCGPKPDDAQATKLALEKADEVQRFVQGLLRSHRIRDIGAMFPSLFSRIYYTYIAARPCILSLLRPRNRFMSEFDARCSRSGIMSLDTALAVLRPLEREAASTLPEPVAQWLSERILRFCSNSQTVPVTRSTFRQIRDLMHNTYQVCNEVIRIIQTNSARADAPATSPASFPSKRRGASSLKSHGAGASWGRQ